jgi:hypothetical protein
MVEDLDSANKTYLNDKLVNRAEIKSGDVIKISDFKIEVEITAKTDEEVPIDLSDTLTGSDETQIIIRTTSSERAPAIKLPARRASDFVRATEEVCKAQGLDHVVGSLLHVAISQFSAWHAWCALRSEPQGPMMSHAGRTMDGHSVSIESLPLADKINVAVEKNQYLLIPRVPRAIRAERIQSAMIAPITSQAGCFGVLYIDNAQTHERYTASDLDYLMMLCIHTAVIVENF